MRKALVVCLLFASLVPVSITLRGETAVKELSLKEAIAYALKNNLDLQVQMTTTESSRNGIKIGESIFIPNLDINFNTQETNTPTTDIFSGAEVRKSKNLDLSLTLSQKIALGGTLDVRLDNSKFESNSIYSTVNPYLSSGLYFTLNQPLLKNFGTLVTKKNIYVAINNYKKSQLQLKQTILDLVYQVEDAYWNLAYAYQNFDTVKTSLERTQDLLKQNELKVKVGILPQIDILDSKAAVALAESNLIQAEQTIQAAEDNFKRILNMSTLEEIVKPADKPEIKKFPVDFNSFLAEALENRPDISQAKLEMKNNQIEVRYARNQTLPNLQLTAQYWTTGQGGDQLIFEEGSSIFEPRKVIGVIKKDVWESMNDAFANLYKNYSISLQLQVPLSFSKERADLAQARLSLQAAFLNLKKTETTIYSEIKEIIKALEFGEKLVEARRITLELEAKKLQAEEKKYSVGLVSNYEVLLKQKDFLQAQTSHIEALKNYNMTIADINRKLSRTFQVYDITFTDFLNR